jgi:nucleoside-diphosphate-sugar epimerase
LVDGIDGENFLVSDNDDASTLDILNVVRTVAKPNLIVFKVPYSFLQQSFRILKRQRIIEKLYHPLQVDCSEAIIKTGWIPVESFDVAFSEYVKWFDSNSRN